MKAEWYKPSSPRAPEVLDTTKRIVGRGSQTLLPFECGDAQVIFESRWQLAQLIEAVLVSRNDAKEKS